MQTTNAWLVLTVCPVALPCARSYEPALVYTSEDGDCRSATDVDRVGACAALFDDSVDTSMYVSRADNRVSLQAMPACCKQRWDRVEEPARHPHASIHMPLLRARCHAFSASCEQCMSLACCCPRCPRRLTRAGYRSTSAPPKTLLMFISMAS